MAVKVRDTLEKIGYDVSYDPKSGGVLVSVGGKTTNIGSDGFTLADDGRYYADSEEDVYSALSKNGLGAGNGWTGARNYLGTSEYVGYNPQTGQMNVNGKAFNVDGTNLVKIGDTVYGRKGYLDSIRSDKYENPNRQTEERALKQLLSRSYQGYDPSEDENYQMAQKDYMTSAKADMGKRGLISDSLASYYAAQGAKKLMPEFAKADYQRYLDENERLKDVISSSKSLTERDISAYRANSAQDSENAENADREREALSDEIKNALDRVKAFGYVTAQDAAVLGVPEGTPSYQVTELEKKHENSKELRSLDNYYDAIKAGRDYGIWKEKNNAELEGKITLAEKTALFKYLYK